MNIEVGEYIRTKYDGIHKVSIDYKNRVADENGNIHFLDEIVQHSKKIIDLIEVGDYVNGNRVYKITSACIYCVGKAVQNKITINIETILTKEQYQANCYTVEVE